MKFNSKKLHPTVKAFALITGLGIFVVGTLTLSSYFEYRTSPVRKTDSTSESSNTPDSTSYVPGGVSVHSSPATVTESLLKERPASPPKNNAVNNLHKRVREIAFENVRGLRPPGVGDEQDAARRFHFELFEDVNFTGSVTRIERHGTDRAVYVGELEDVPGDFILAYNQGVVMATFSTPTLGSYQIRYLGEGRHAAVELDPGKFPACETLPVPQAEEPLPADSLQNRQARVALYNLISQANVPDPVEGAVYNGLGQQGGSDDGLTFTEIDVMILHTTASTTAAGGTAGMQALIDATLARANSAFINSDVGIRLRLVRVEEVSYSESNHNTDLTNLKDAEGALSSVPTWRNQSGADLVSLITTNSGGLAYLYNGNANSDDFGFSVVGVAGPESTFVHEVGHNLGLRHDRDNDNTSNPLTSYSYGWRFTPSDGPELRTIMAYAPGQQIPYFSNPDITYMGTPTGVAIGQALQSDNAQALRNTKAAIAAFRSANGNLPPTITLDTPLYTDRYLALDSVSLAATASDSDGSVQEVRFYRLKSDATYGFSNWDSTPLGSDASQPYSSSESEAPAGFWTYAVVAFDDDGGYGVDTVSVSIAPHYRRYTPPLPAGKIRVEVEGINEAGRFVGFGHNGNRDATDVQAAYWENDTITLLNPLSGDTGAKALALDADGVVYGESISSEGVRRAVKWENSITATDLSTVIAGYTAESALGVDEAGRVYLASGNDYRRFDDPGSTVTGLNQRWEKVAATGNFATGIDYESTAPVGWRAMRWNGSGTRLSPLSGFSSSWGFATNRSGSVIGFSDPNPGGWNTGTNRLTFWPAGSATPVDLGTFGATGGWAYDLNDFNHGVGTANESEFSSLAFIWKGEGALLDLNRVVLPQSGVLQDARVINNKGQIAGTGFVSSDQILFFLDPLPGLDHDYWLANHFVPAELTDTALTADNASPAGDGVPNLLKRGLGLDPRLSALDTPAEAAALPRIDSDENGNVLFTIRRLRTPGELSYTPQASLSLSNIDWDPNLLEVIDIIPLDNNFEEVILRNSSPIPEPGHMFLRLEVGKE